MRWSDIDRDTFLFYRNQLTAGHYSVIVKDKLECANATLEFDIIKQPIPKADIPLFLCVGDTFTIRPYLDETGVNGYFYYGRNRLSHMADSLIFTMPDLADTTVNIFFVNQNPQCASEIRELIFKRNSSVKPFADSTITYCSDNQDVELVSGYGNTIWYSLDHKNNIDTSHSIQFNPTSSVDTLLVYMQSSSETCNSDTSQIIIQQSNFNYSLDTSKGNSWIYLFGGNPEYRIQISGDTLVNIANIKDTIRFENILSTGKYNFSLYDSNDCEIALHGIFIYNNKTLLSDFILYPNPASNYFQIAGIYNTAQIMVYTVDGKKVFEGTAMNEQLISLFDVASGIYIVRVEEKDRKKIFKLIVK